MTHICINFSTVYNDTLVAKGLSFSMCCGLTHEIRLCREGLILNVRSGPILAWD